MNVGLWIRDSSNSEFLISRDKHGYPRLIAFDQKDRFYENDQSIRDVEIGEGKRLYQEMTGKAYPFGHATSRQVLWDLIEASLKLLP